jgi:hypothetical protein
MADNHCDSQPGQGQSLHLAAHFLGYNREKRITNEPVHSILIIDDEPNLKCSLGLICNVPAIQRLPPMLQKDPVIASGAMINFPG